MTEKTPYILQQAPPPAARTSKDVARRLAAGRGLRAALRVQGPDVAHRSQARLRKHLRPGDAEVDVHATVVAHDRQLEAAEETLSEKEAKLYEVQAELAAAIQERRERQSLMRAQMVGLRFTVVGQFIAPDVVGLGLEKHTARAVDPLVRQVERTGKNLLQDDVKRWLGKSLFPEPTFGPAVHGRHLVASAEVMKALLRRIDETRRRRDAALLAKREALDAYDETYLRTARMFEELCRHAGKVELAERVRPTVKKRRQSLVEPVGEVEEASRRDEERPEEHGGEEIHAIMTNEPEIQEESPWPRSHDPSRPGKGRADDEMPRERRRGVGLLAAESSMRKKSGG